MAEEGTRNVIGVAAALTNASNDMHQLASDYGMVHFPRFSFPIFRSRRHPEGLSITKRIVIGCRLRDVRRHLANTHGPSRLSRTRLKNILSGVRGKAGVEVGCRGGLHLAGPIH